MPFLGDRSPEGPIAAEGWRGGAPPLALLLCDDSDPLALTVFPWVPLGPPGSPWVPLAPPGFPWVPLAFLSALPWPPWNSIKLA